MSWLKVIWTFAKRFYLCLPLDTRYILMDDHDLQNLIVEYQVKNLYYTAEVFDCDDFAWVFKGVAAERRYQAVGFVIGWDKGLHCWNVVITETGLKWIEPQTGNIRTGGWPWLVII